MINEDGTVGIDTPETRAAIEYAKELYATCAGPGRRRWRRGGVPRRLRRWAR
jgi:hypothetical protein